MLELGKQNNQGRSERNVIAQRSFRNITLTRQPFSLKVAVPTPSLKGTPCYMMHLAILT